MTQVKFSSVSKLSAKDAFEYYKQKNPGTTVNYTFYKYVITEFNKMLTKHILDGNRFNMGHRLGYLKIKKIERTFNNPTIDWGETNKLIAQGIRQYVYYTDDHYYKWHWDKHMCRVKNKSVYKFMTTGGPTGNRRALSQRLKNDEFAYLNYK